MKTLVNRLSSLFRLQHINAEGEYSVDQSGLSFRRRLVGTIALVGLGALIVFVVLDGEPVQVTRGPGPAVIDEAVTERRTAEASSAVVEPDQSVQAVATPSKAESVEKESAVDPSSKVEDVKEVPPKPTAEALQEPPVANSAASGYPEELAINNSYAIQIGAVQNMTRADKLCSMVVEIENHCFKERIAVPSGELLRVRLGPYPTQRAAQQVRAKLALRGISGAMVKQKSAGSRETTRWP